MKIHRKFTSGYLLCDRATLNVNVSSKGGHFENKAWVVVTILNPQLQPAVKIVAYGNYTAQSLLKDKWNASDYREAICKLSTPPKSELHH